MRSLVLVFFLYSLNTLAADDKIVVTATRTETKAEDLPFSVSAVSRERWDQSGGKIEEALSNIPGLSFAVNGGAGQTRSLFIRGSKSEHVLVLVDGIPVNDPLSPSRAFDFAQIPVDDIERVEVIKGPQSVLYGSDAMGGVVQIFTAKNPRGQARVEGGSYRTLHARVSSMGFRAGYRESRGFSSADEREGNPEADGYEAWNIGGTKDFVVNENFLMNLHAQYQDSRTDTDRGGGAPTAFSGDSYNTFARHTQFLLREENVVLLPNEAELSIAGNYSSHDREENTNGGDFYRAQLWKAETIYRKPNLGIHSFTLGAEYGEESGRSSQILGTRRFRNGALYLQDLLKVNRFHASLGARLDLLSESGSVRTYRAGLGYWLLPDFLRVKSSLGTGFKAPSLYQSYSTAGSPHLAAEKSVGGDLGVELTRENWGTELTYFANRFTNQIDYDSTTKKYFNQAKVETWGLEWMLERRFGLFRASNALTLLRARDPATGLLLKRRPLVTDTLEFGFTKEKEFGAGLRWRYVGYREDLYSVPTGTIYTAQPMPAFFTLGLDAFHELGEGFRLTARGENLLNRRYQETSGFGTPGLSGYLGLEADL